MSIKHLIKTASSIVNTVLGEVYNYEHHTGDFTNDVNVIIDRNKAVMDDHNLIIGYRVEASLLKSEIPKIHNQEYILDADGTRWEITQVTKETSAKWYVDIIEI